MRVYSVDPPSSVYFDHLVKKTVGPPIDIDKQHLLIHRPAQIVGFQIYNISGIMDHGIVPDHHVSKGLWRFEHPLDSGRSIPKRFLIGPLLKCRQLSRNCGSWGGFSMGEATAHKHSDH